MINIWREQHHFNARKTPGYSLNPRIYEALACGALVVTEDRAELDSVFPGLPTFSNPKELVAQLEWLLSEPDTMAKLVRIFRRNLEGHTYADRLARILKVCLGWEKGSDES